MKASRFTFAVIAIAALILGACMPVQRGGAALVQQYNGLITAYQAGQRETINGKNCVVMVYTDLTIQIGLANTAMQAEVARTAAYRDALAEYGTKVNDQIAGAQKQYEGQLGVYSDQNGNVLPPERLDLAKVAAAGAFPAQLVGTLNVFVTSFTEAPLPPANFEPILLAQRETAEKMNLLFACSKTSNDAIFQYNIERQKVSGRVVGDIAEYLGVSELPAELPYFALQGSTAPPVVPTFGAP